MKMVFTGQPDRLFPIEPGTVCEVISIHNSQMPMYIKGYGYCPYSSLDSFLANWDVPEQTCHNDALKVDQFICSECRKWYDIVDMEDDDWSGVPNHCPNCGARVVK